MPYDRAICSKPHTNADMAVHQCVKCNGWWATNCSAGLVITMYCPTCIAVVFSRKLTDDQMSRMYSDRMDARVIEAERADRLEERIESIQYGTEDEPLSFPERYCELRDLGYPDWQIAKRLGIAETSLQRQVERYGLQHRTAS